MSYLAQNAMFYAVLFDENFHMKFNHPFYSLPAYDQKQKGKQMLFSHIIRRKKDEHKYAVIYDNQTRQPLHYFIDGNEVKSFQIPSEVLKCWVLFKDGTTNIARQIYQNEEQTYWYLVNTCIKAKEIRNRVQFARIYDRSENIIGQFKLNEKNQLIGNGKFHAQTHTV